MMREVQPQRPVAEVVQVVLDARAIFSTVSVSPRSPFTCAQPVMPGRTLWRIDAALDQLAIHLVVRDGVRPRPHDAHAARSTLRNCGSSSSEVRRRKAPKGVTRAVVLRRLRDDRAVLGDRHRAELANDHLLAVEAVAALPEERGPGEDISTPTGIAARTGAISADEDQRKHDVETRFTTRSRRRTALAHRQHREPPIVSIRAWELR